MRKAAIEQGRSELISIQAGQGASLIHRRGAPELMGDLTGEMAGYWGGWPPIKRRMRRRSRSRTAYMFVWAFGSLAMGAMGYDLVTAASAVAMPAASANCNATEAGT